MESNNVQNIPKVMEHLYQWKHTQIIYLKYSFLNLFLVQVILVKHKISIMGPFSQKQNIFPQK